jgi:GNAT superfamily N-acetyltransferase
MSAVRLLKEPEDLKGVEALFRHLPDPLLVGGGIFPQSEGSSGSHSVQLVGESGGVITGYAITARHSELPARAAFVWIVVDPAHRRQGLGSKLFSEIQTAYLSPDVQTLHTWMVAEDQASAAFVSRYGFVMDHESYRSALRLPASNLTAFDQYVTHLEGIGITFTTMADQPDIPESRQKLYGLNRDILKGLPGWDGTYPTYEEFCSNVLGSPSYLPEAYFLATFKGRWLGLAALRRIGTGRMHHTVTGVLSDNRKLGIGTALKVLCIRYAQSQGVSVISTGNHSDNVPMLRINEMLGYKPVARRIHLKKSL